MCIFVDPDVSLYWHNEIKRWIPCINKFMMLVRITTNNNTFYSMWFHRIIALVIITLACFHDRKVGLQKTIILNFSRQFANGFCNKIKKEFYYWSSIWFFYNIITYNHGPVCNAFSFNAYFCQIFVLKETK